MSFRVLLLQLLVLLSLSVSGYSQETRQSNVPLAEIWFQTSGEYRAICLQTYNLAWVQFQNWKPLLNRGADGRAYLTGSSKPVAIILDLDETVIDNIGFQAYQSKTGTSYTPELWSHWVLYQAQHPEAGRTVPGAVEFLNKVEALGVTPLFVSNRSVGDEPATIKVLERAGVNVEGVTSRLYFHLLKDEETERARSTARELGLSPDSPEAVALVRGEGAKEARRRLIKQEYDVVAYFGDVLGDFEPFVDMANSTRQTFEQRQDVVDENRGRWGTAWFILPNPIYGSWERAVPKEKRDAVLTDYGFGEFLRTR